MMTQDSRDDSNQLVPQSNPLIEHTFISYSRRDADLVKRLTADLGARGVRVWIDTRGLKPGTRNWEHALREALRNSYAALLIASPDSRISNYVQAEMAVAEMYKRPIFPLWAAGDDWIDSVPLEFVRTQHIDLRGEEAYQTGIEQIAQILLELQRQDRPTDVIAPVVIKPDTRSTPRLLLTRRNPYKGLRAFSRDDASDFFGRGTLVELLTKNIDAALNAPQHVPPERMLAVVGPSGSGKSSVVMAGLLPHLQGGALPGSDKWVYLPPIIPGRRPLESLAAVLAHATNDSIDQMLEDLESPRRLHRIASMLAGGGAGQVVVFIDQFEEVFTQAENEEERRQFIDLVVNAAAEPRGAALVILTMRADFYDRPMNYSALGKLLEKRSRSVLPMNLHNLRDVIEKPAQLPDVQVRFEDGLVGDLLFEVRDQAGALPLLQFTLAQLFDKRSDDLLTLDAYRELGGVRGALKAHAETVYHSLPTDRHRALSRALFMRLIEPGLTEQDTTRRRANRDELKLDDQEQTRILNETAAIFVNARLLVTSTADDIETIEVSHEALIREWERLAGWLSSAREDIRLQKKVSADVGEWMRQGRTRDLLYRGRVLREALDWAVNNFPSADESEFLRTSEEEERVIEARELQRIADLRLAEETARRAQEEANQAQQVARQESQRSEQSARRANRLRAIAGAVGFLAALIAVAAFMTALTASNQVSDANATLTPIAGTLVSAEEQVAGVRPTLAQAETQIAGVAPTLARAETQIAGVAPTLAQAETQIAEVQPTLAAAQGRIVQAEAQIATATIEQGNALRAAALAQADVARSLDLAAGAQTQAAAAERTLAPIPSTLTPIAATLSAAEAQVAGVQPTLDSAATQVAGVEPTLAAAEAQLAGVRPTLDSASTQIAGVEPTLAQAQALVFAANAALTPIPVTLTFSAEQIAQAQADIARANEEAAVSAQQATAANVLVQDARQQVADANATLTPLPLTLTPAQLTLQAADAFAATAQRDVLLFGQTLTPIPATLAFSAAQIAQAQADIARANEAAALSAQQATAANVLVQDARQQVAEANATLTPLPLTLTPAQRTLEAANALAAIAQQEVIAFGQTLTPIPATLAFSAAQIAQAQADIARANQEAVIAAQQATAANVLVQDARQQVAEANATLTPIPLTLTPAQRTLEAANAFAATAQQEVIVFGQTLTPIPATLAFSAQQIAQAQRDIARANQEAAIAAQQATAAGEAVVQANIAAEDARLQVAQANATLTPLPLTLTPAQRTLEAANAFAATAQQEVIAFGQTLTPIPATLAFSAEQIAEAQAGIERANAAAAVAAQQATAANDAVLAANIAAAEAREQVAAANATLAPIPLTLTPVPQTLTPIGATLAAAETVVAGVAPTLNSAATQVAGVQPTLAAAEAQIAGVQPTLDRAGTQVAEVAPTLTGVAVEIAAQQEIADSLRVAAAAEQILGAGNPDLSLALALKAYEFNSALPQVQRVLNALRPFTPRYVTSIDAQNSRLSALITPQSISYAAFSPDGRSIAIPEGSNQVIVRDLTSRRIIFTLDAGARAAVVRYSPGGRWLAVGTSRSVVIFESSTGFEHSRFNISGAVTALAFSQDERYLIIGMSRSGADVWDIEARARYMQINVSSTGTTLNPVRDVGFSENASQAYLYDGAQMGIADMVRRTARFNLVGNIRGVSPDLRYGVVGGQGDTFVTLWNPISYQREREFRLGAFNVDYLETIAFSRDRRFVMVHLETRSYTDRTRNLYTITGRRVEYWQVADGSRIAVMRTPQLSPRVWDVTAMAISDDGRYGITGGFYGAVSAASVWDLMTGEELRRFEGHSSPILAAGFSPNAGSVYTLSQDSVRVWDLGDPRSLAQGRLSLPAREIAAIGFSPDQNEMFIAYDGIAMGRWSLATQRQDGNRRFSTGGQVAVAFSPAQNRALVASVESLTLWNLDTVNEFLYRIPDVNPNTIRAIRFSQNGQFMYWLSAGRVTRWDVIARQGATYGGAQGAHLFAVDALNENILTASETRIQIADVIDRQTQEFRGFTGRIRAIDLSGGGDFVAAGVAEPENAVMIWDARTGARRFDLRAHTAPVTIVRFSQDGRLLVSGSLDTTLILWDVATGQVLQTFRGHTAPIVEIAFAPDGRTFASLSESPEDGILFWRAETAAETVDWFYANRNVSELSCEQRGQFGVRPQCIQGVAPTLTPSRTPLPTVGPTATSTPRPTPTITPTPFPTGQVIAAENIRLRRGFEGEAFTFVIGTAAPGERVTVLEIRRDIGWVRIRNARGQEGWTRLDFIRINN